LVEGARRPLSFGLSLYFTDFLLNFPFDLLNLAFDLFRFVIRYFAYFARAKTRTSNTA
jgi:hypothetical protein